MKSLFKVFLGVVCITFLFACDRTHWEKSNNVKVAWDSSETKSDKSPTDQKRVFLYNVYIDVDTDNTHDDKILMTKEPIAETEYIIPTIEHKGKYFIGIQTLAYKVKDGEKYGEPAMSEISWSNNKSATQKGTFGVKIK